MIWKFCEFENLMGIRFQKSQSMRDFISQSEVWYVCCVKRWPQKDQKLVFKTNYRLMQVEKYWRMHSAILSTFLKLPIVLSS